MLACTGRLKITTLYLSLNISCIGRQIVLHLLLEFVPPVSGDKLEDIISRRHEKCMRQGFSGVVQLRHPSFLTHAVLQNPRIPLLLPQLSHLFRDHEYCFVSSGTSS